MIYFAVYSHDKLKLNPPTRGAYAYISIKPIANCSSNIEYYKSLEICIKQRKLFKKKHCCYNTRIYLKEN